MTVSPDPSQALAAIRARIDQAVLDSGRAPGSVALLAVSKQQSAAQIRALYAAGQRAFGENYVQELEAKHAALADLPGLEWHLIGPLQSNKTRFVAEQARWVHSLDRLKIAERLSAQRPAGLPPLEVCVQVNISGEASKSGVAPEAALALLQAVATLPRLRLRGLMGVAEAGADAAETRRQFSQLAALLAQAQTALPGQRLDTLSMGMSADLELAVACGSTCVRVGSALFGARVYPA